MTEVRTYFKAGTPGGPPLQPDDRVFGASSLGRRRSKALGATRSRPKAKTGGITRELRSDVLRAAGGRCQAAGLHHRDCPGTLDPAWGWNVHHVQPRSKGGSDELGNLIAVWTGGPAAAGCHGRLHANPAEAKALGLLLGRAA